MMAPITSKPAWGDQILSVESIAESFMELCEAKGDYSLFTLRQSGTNDQGGDPPRDIAFDFAVHCLGAGQRGEKDPRGIRLKDIVILEKSTLCCRAREKQLCWA